MPLACKYWHLKLGEQRNPPMPAWQHLVLAADQGLPYVSSFLLNRNFYWALSYICFPTDHVLGERRAETCLFRVSSEITRWCGTHPPKGEFAYHLEISWYWFWRSRLGVTWCVSLGERVLCYVHVRKIEIHILMSRRANHGKNCLGAHNLISSSVQEYSSRTQPPSQLCAATWWVPATEK